MQGQLNSLLVFWTQSTTRDYIMAENELHSISSWLRINHLTLTIIKTFHIKVYNNSPSKHFTQTALQHTSWGKTCHPWWYNCSDVSLTTPWTHYLLLGPIFPSTRWEKFEQNMHSQRISSVFPFSKDTLFQRNVILVLSLSIFFDTKTVIQRKLFPILNPSFPTRTQYSMGD